MTDLQGIKKQNVVLLKEALNIAEQTNTMAKDVNVELNGQGEKLVGINQKLNKINNTLDESENTAKEISSFWYRLKNKIKRAFGITRTPAFKDDSDAPGPKPEVAS